MSDLIDASTIMAVWTDQFEGTGTLPVTAFTGIAAGDASFSPPARYPRGWKRTVATAGSPVRLLVQLQVLGQSSPDDPSVPIEL